MKRTTDETITSVAVGIRHDDSSGLSRGLSVPVFLRADGFGQLVRYEDGTVEITMGEDDVRTLISMFDDLVLSAEKDLAGIREYQVYDYEAARPAWKRFAERRNLIKQLLKEHDDKLAAAAASVKEPSPNATPPAIPR